MLKKVEGMLKVMFKSLFEKGYKFFFENYLFGVLCLLNGSEVHVKGMCYRSQRKSDRPHDVMVILSLAGNVNKATVLDKSPWQAWIR